MSTIKKDSSGYFSHYLVESTRLFEYGNHHRWNRRHLVLWIKDQLFDRILIRVMYMFFFRIGYGARLLILILRNKVMLVILEIVVGLIMLLIIIDLDRFKMDKIR